MLYFNHNWNLSMRLILGMVIGVLPGVWEYVLERPEDS
jgi:hypothetical protein